MQQQYNADSGAKIGGKPLSGVSSRVTHYNWRHELASAVQHIGDHMKYTRPLVRVRLHVLVSDDEHASQGDLPVVSRSKFQDTWPRSGRDTFQHQTESEQERAAKKIARIPGKTHEVLSLARLSLWTWEG